MALTKFKTFLEQAPAKDYVPKKDGDEEAKGLEPRSKGERDFKAKHTIKKTGHPAAADKQFKAEETDLDESMVDSWKRVQSMDKGSVTGGKEEARKRLAYLNAVHDHHKKYGNDTKKVKSEIEKMKRSRIAEEQFDESEKMGRADYKTSPSGRKVRKFVTFKNAEDAAKKEREDKED